MAWIRCTGNTGGSLKVRTASGAIASFETNMVDLLQSVKCEINAKQDLHGEDKPYPAGGGVNLFDKNNTFEGYIVDTTGNFSPRTGDVATDFISVVGGASYYVKSEQGQGMWGAWYNENKEYISACTGYANRVITAPTNAKFVRLTVVHNSGNVDTFGFNYPATDTTYHAYDGQTYTIAFGQTVYGGVLDVTRGKLKPCIEYPSYNGETLSGRWLSSEATYIEGTTPPTGSQVVSLDDYGSDIDLTPEVISAVVGTNNVYSDTNGDTTVKFKDTIQNYIDKKVST